MSATTWLIIAIVGFSLAGIAFIVAIFMFIKMNIPAIIGDLSGKTVAREIKAMREANVLSGDKRFRPSKVNLERGTLTEKVDQKALDAETLKKAHASKRLDRTTGELSENLVSKKGGTVGLGAGHVDESQFGGTPTEALSSATEVLSDNATEVLSDNYTEVLSPNVTEVLSDGATEILKSSDTEVLSGGTTVLSQTEELEKTDVTPVSFTIIESKIVIHSDEVI